jgi:hypothetical protein
MLHAMRIALSLVMVLLVASQAYADSGSGAAFDFGYTRNRVAVSDHTALDGDTVRFGIRVSLGRHFHFGGEAEEGQLAGTTAQPAGYVARTSTEQPPVAGPLDGNTLGLKAYAGVHAQAGSFLFGADLAGGVRDTWVSSDLGMDVAGYKNEPLLEVRTRADLLLGDSVSIGAVASTDMFERRNVALGAVLSLQFAR